MYDWERKERVVLADDLDAAKKRAEKQGWTVGSRTPQGPPVVQHVKTTSGVTIEKHHETAVLHLQRKKRRA